MNVQYEIKQWSSYKQMHMIISIGVWDSAR